VSVVQLTDANFQTEVLGAASTVGGAVWAQWCGPCRLMAPMMEWLDAEYAGRLAVGKLEADGNPTSRDALAIQGLPTLILFKNGQELARHEGAMAKPKLQAFVDAHL
jgi:thioredoxin 1